MKMRNIFITCLCLFSNACIQQASNTIDIASLVSARVDKIVADKVEEAISKKTELASIAFSGVNPKNNGALMHGAADTYLGKMTVRVKSLKKLKDGTLVLRMTASPMFSAVVSKSTYKIKVLGKNGEVAFPIKEVTKRLYSGKENDFTLTYINNEYSNSSDILFSDDVTLAIKVTVEEWH